MDQRKAIGNDNQLPWHLPADLKRFKEITWGKPIIMGRKTFESIGKPLPGRLNMIVTQQASYNAPGCITFENLQSALTHVQFCDEAFIIGGSSLYEQSLGHVDRMYLTLIHHSFKADSYFPDWSEEDWQVIERHDYKPDDKNTYHYSYLVLSRAQPTLKC